MSSRHIRGNDTKSYIQQSGKNKLEFALAFGRKPAPWPLNPLLKDPKPLLTVCADPLGTPMRMLHRALGQPGCRLRASKCLKTCRVASFAASRDLSSCFLIRVCYVFRSWLRGHEELRCLQGIPVEALKPLVLLADSQPIPAWSTAGTLGPRVISSFSTQAAVPFSDSEVDLMLMHSLSDSWCLSTTLPVSIFGQAESCKFFKPPGFTGSRSPGRGLKTSQSSELRGPTSHRCHTVGDLDRALIKRSTYPQKDHSRYRMPR